MKNAFVVFVSCILFFSCKKEIKPIPEPTMIKSELKKKEVVYQVFTRLFGNTDTNNKPWGTIEENGVGKFADFTEKALKEIKDLGVTYIWYTGVPHHDVIQIIQNMEFPMTTQMLLKVEPVHLML